MTAWEQAQDEAAKAMNRECPAWFQIDGCSAIFIGTVSEPRRVVDVGLGGGEPDHELRISARKDQFKAVNWTVKHGQVVLYGGRRWDIRDLPGLNSDPVCYEITAFGRLNSR